MNKEFVLKTMFSTYVKSTDFRTDIQFMLSGAVKEAGLLVQINKYIKERYGNSPFGENFNVRNAPKSISDDWITINDKVDSIFSGYDSLNSNSKILKHRQVNEQRKT